MLSTGSHQETRCGTEYRCKPRNAAGRTPRRADRSQSARGHPTTTWGGRDGADPTCTISRPQGRSTSSLPCETRIWKIRIFDEE
jgi:hypothetical protein